MIISNKFSWLAQGYKVEDILHVGILVPVSTAFLPGYPPAAPLMHQRSLSEMN